VECDGIVIGTSRDLSYILKLNKPSVLASCNLQMVSEHSEQLNHSLDSVAELLVLQI
jgi:hypothetical protein